jgi:hypothetical protein
MLFPIFTRIIEREDVVLNLPRGRVIDLLRKKQTERREPESTSFWAEFESQFVMGRASGGHRTA